MTKDEITAWHAAHPYGARDEAYIDAVLAHVKRLWLDHPTERLGQMLETTAVLSTCHGDPFFARDEEWMCGAAAKSDVHAERDRLVLRNKELEARLEAVRKAAK